MKRVSVCCGAKTDRGSEPGGGSLDRRIAIVGPTGCGKTTLINLLMRFYDVNAGSMCAWTITDIRHVTRHCLRGNYGMVLQDAWAARLVPFGTTSRMADVRTPRRRKSIAAAKARSCPWLYPAACRRATTR